jgi:predicted dehydrogenase
MGDFMGNKNEVKSKMNRRDFMLTGAGSVAAFTIVPRHVLGGPGNTPPSEKLNIAGIGVGGKGAGDIGGVSSENIVALCDVDEKQAGETFEKYTKARKYQDFRVMLEKEEKNIDAVVVATPDHIHAPASMMAIRMGKHVFVEKPMTHSIYEARKLTEAARKYKVATQMGNQGHSGEGCRLICEWIWDGAIGPVREVHAWTNRPIWPQGMDRPEEVHEVPSTLNWDLWLGPAPERPFNKAYQPFKWRGWWDFGTGALGDMACHIIDPAVWALKLDNPTSVKAVSTNVNSETAPLASVIDYEFPARGDMPPVKMTWYDGDIRPTDPPELEQGRRMGSQNGGVLFVGDKGKLECGCYGKSPRIIPETKMKEYKKPEKTIPRVEGHHQDWIQACKGGTPACSNFDVSGPLTEIVLLGNLAIRTGRRIEWDGANIKCTNYPEANNFVRREYRKGWTL